LLDRIRRIKCDETIPHCHRCTSTGRKCDGPIVQKFRLASDTSLERRRHDNDVPAPTTLSSPHSDKPEQRAFDFFLRRVVPVFSGALDLEFWSHSILQISRSEPVVWYAVIAISSLFEHPQYSTSLSVEPGDEALETDSVHRQALKWYNRSISRLREQIEQDAASASVALLSCLLFICVELLQNNIAGALSLFQNGIKMMRNMAQKTSSSATQYGLENQPSSRLIRDTLSAFLRVGVMPVSGSCTQQYEGIISPESVSNEANSWQLTEMLEYGPEQAESVDLFNLDTDLGSPLDRLADARQALQALMTDCYTVIQVGESCKNMLHQNPNQVAALSSRQHNLKSKLRAWHSRFSGFNTSFRHAATSKQL
jgi:Fungal Zn(2)-Cys(6) binuclear cluster domain